MRLGLTTSHAMSVGVATAISTGTASGLNVPNARGRAALLAPRAGAPGNAFETVGFAGPSSDRRHGLHVRPHPAACGLNVGDIFHQQRRLWVRLHESGHEYRLARLATVRARARSNTPCRT